VRTEVNKEVCRYRATENGCKYEREKIVSNVQGIEEYMRQGNGMHTDTCTYEERRGIGWWKMSIWRMKRIRGTLVRECVLFVENRKDEATS
jgi:hypothetical protein